MFRVLPLPARISVRWFKVLYRTSRSIGNRLDLRRSFMAISAVSSCRPKSRIFSDTIQRTPIFKLTQKLYIYLIGWRYGFLTVFFDPPQPFSQFRFESPITWGIQGQIRQGFRQAL